MEQLTAFKDYLAEKPEFAILALSLVGLVYLFRKYDRARLEQVQMVNQLAPLTDKLCRLIERIKVFNDRWNSQ